MHNGISENIAEKLKLKSKVTKKYNNKYNKHVAEQAHVYLQSIQHNGKKLSTRKHATFMKSKSKSASEC